MKKYGGIYIGTGAVLNIGLGFEPDFVRLYNGGEAEGDIIEWDRTMQRLDLTFGGRFQSALAGDESLLTQDNGIMLYRGGTRIVTPSSAYIIPAVLVATYAGNMAAKGTGATLSKWTLGSLANATGNWNAECNTTYVGVGSEIWIRPDADQDVVLRRTITALTSNGDQANEVTLDQAAGTGVIERVSYLADFVQAPAGFVMPAGITINDVTHLNATSQPNGIIVEQWDGKL